MSKLSANEMVNVVKLTLGPAVVRFETERGATVAMRYAAKGGGRPVSLDAAREEIATLRDLGWQVAAA